MQEQLINHTSLKFKPDFMTWTKRRDDSVQFIMSYMILCRGDDGNSSNALRWLLEPEDQGVSGDSASCC